MHCLKPYLIAFSFGLPLTAQAAASTPLPAKIVSGPCIEGVCEYHLSNGMRVLLIPDATKTTVTVNMVYDVGSVDENYGETGMAHLLEHMMFKGTPKHPDIPGEMKQHGINKNASTSFDRTNYFASFPANDDTLDWLLGLEADRMVNSKIAKKDLDGEMTVVRNEMEMGQNNSGTVLMQQVRSVAYDWHNYAKQPIGVRSDIEGVPIGNLQAFYRTWYQPDNALLVIAGRFDSTKVLPRIATNFGVIKTPSRVLPAFHTIEPVQDGEREVTIRRVGNVSAIAVAYHIPAMAQADTAALSVLANVLSDNPNGRLYKALIQTKLAAFGGAGNEEMRDPGLFTMIAVVPQTSDPAKAETELLRQAEGIATRPITDQEVTAAKQRIANATEQLLNDVNAVGMGLSEYQAAGDWRLLFIQRDAVAKVTTADVNRVAAAYLRRSNRTLGRFVPTPNPEFSEIPNAPSVASLVNGYAGKTAIAAGETFDSTPQSIEARTQTFILGNGLKVSLLPKKTRGNTVVLDATFHFGNEKSITGRSNAGQLVGPMLMLGSKTMTREQIAAKFDALQTKAQIGGSIQAALIKLMGKRETLADALALAADVLRNPTFPQDQFEQLRLQAITGLEYQRTEPAVIAMSHLAAYFDPWPKGHPLHTDSIDESLVNLKAAQLNDVRAYHHEFYGTSEGEISVVGDFDPVIVKALLESLFVNWKPPIAYQPISTHYMNIKAKRETFATSGKPNAVLLARQNLSINVVDEDFPALNIAVSILGGDPLKARLADRIRQKEGLSYSVTSGLQADQSRVGRDDNGYLVIQAIAAPQNIPKVETAIREEFSRLIKDGVSEQEVRDAVSANLVARQQSRASDPAVAGMLSEHMFFNRRMQFEVDRDRAYQSLTAPQVNAVIRKYLKPDSLSVFEAGDFKQ